MKYFFCPNINMNYKLKHLKEDFIGPNINMSMIL